MPVTDVFISMCMGVLPEHTSVHHVHSDAQGDQKKALDFLELEPDSCNLSCGCWTSNLGPLEE